MVKYLLNLCHLYQFPKSVTMKAFFLLIVIVISCRVADSSQHIEHSRRIENCCKVYENTHPIDFSKMKSVLEHNSNHLLDVYTIERTSGRPDLDLTLHLFKTENGVIAFEQKIGQKPIKNFVISDTSIWSLVKKVSRNNYYQQCLDDGSTLLINRFFEVKSKGIVLQSCYLTNGGSENICDEDKSKILIANKVFEQMKKNAKY